MDAYPGPVRHTAQGGTLYDFYRIALHEFGHAAGLDHPDEAGQAVVASPGERASEGGAESSGEVVLRSG